MFGEASMRRGLLPFERLTETAWMSVEAGGDVRCVLLPPLCCCWHPSKGTSPVLGHDVCPCWITCHHSYWAAQLTKMGPWCRQCLFKWQEKGSHFHNGKPRKHAGIFAFVGRLYQVPIQARSPSCDIQGVPEGGAQRVQSIWYGNKDSYIVALGSQRRPPLCALSNVRAL